MSSRDDERVVRCRWCPVWEKTTGSNAPWDFPVLEERGPLHSSLSGIEPWPGGRNEVLGLMIRSGGFPRCELEANSTAFVNDQTG